MQVNWLDKVTDWGWQAFMTIGGAALGWIFYMERRISGLRLHVAENYVKKTDLIELKEEIASQFKDVKGSQDQIIDLLLQRKIGTNRRG